MSNYLIDTHAHVVSKYYENIDEVIENSLCNDVNQIINCAYDIESSIEIVSLCSKYKNMYGSIGVHPSDVDKYEVSDLSFIEDYIDNDKIIAIGEIGLDYHYEGYDKEKQILFLEKQLEYAEKYNIPVVIHSRDATMDTLNVLKKFNVKGVVHSFSGSYETAVEYINMGYLIGVNGVVTFKNCNFKEILTKLPLSSIILETDCPYLTPVPYRGQKNQPAYIKNIAEFVSSVYNISLEELMDETTKNTLKMFNKMEHFDK